MMRCSNLPNAPLRIKFKSILRSQEAMEEHARGRLSEVLYRLTHILTRPYFQKRLNRKRLNLALMPILARMSFRNLERDFRFWTMSLQPFLSRIAQTRREQVAILHLAFHSSQSTWDLKWPTETIPQRSEPLLSQVRLKVRMKSVLRPICAQNTKSA